MFTTIFLAIRAGKFSQEQLNGVGVERWARASEHGGKLPSTAGEAEELGSADPLGFSVSKNLTDQRRERG